MVRKHIHPSQYDDLTLGVLAYVAWGRLTAAEGARALGVSRWTTQRLARALYGREPTEARRAYVRRLIASADRTARRPLTKAQLRKIADEAIAKREQSTITADTSNPAVS